MRHSSFRRWSPGADPLRLQDRDRAILVSVYRFRYLTREHLGHLHFPGCAEKVVRLRLRKLWNAALLKRVWLPFVLDEESGGKGLIGPIYCLGKEGRGCVARHLGVGLAGLILPKRGRTTSPFTLVHDLAVNTAVIALSVGLAARTGEPPLAFELSWHLYHRLARYREQTRLRLPVPIADAAVSAVPGQVLLLEVDRGTEPLHRICEKVGRYAHLNRLGLLRSLFAASTIQVVYLAPSSVRAASLASTLAQTAPTSVFWVAACPPADLGPSAILALPCSSTSGTETVPLAGLLGATASVPAMSQPSTYATHSSPSANPSTQTGPASPALAHTPG